MGNGARPRLKDKSFRKLDIRIRKIHDYKKGHMPVLEDNPRTIIDVSQEEIEESEEVSHE